MKQEKPRVTAGLPTERRMFSLAAVLLVLSLVIFVCQLANLGTLRARASGAESLPVSIRAASRANYSADTDPTSLPPINEDILKQIILDIPSTGSPQDRIATMQVALLSPVPTMTSNYRLSTTPAPIATKTSVNPTSFVSGMGMTFAAPTYFVPPNPTVSNSYATYPAPTSTKRHKQSAEKTATPTASPTSTITPSQTLTGSPTITLGPSSTPTVTASVTPSSTSTPTSTFTQTPSPTYTLTNTPTVTLTPSATATETPTETLVATPTVTPTVTATQTLTETPTVTLSPSATATEISTQTPTPTNTFTSTPSATSSPTTTLTYTPSETPTLTATATNTNTATAAASLTHTATETMTVAPTSTPTATWTATETYTPSSTSTPTFTHTATLTPSLTPTLTATITYTMTPTLIPTPTETLTPTDTVTPTFTPTATETSTSTATSTDTATATFTATLTPTYTATFTPTTTYTATVTFTPSPTAMPVSPACYAGTPNGLLPSDDTYIDGGSPTRNFGSDVSFDVRPDNNADRRGLVKFDLTTIPANANITSATLYLFEGGNKTGQTTYIYRVTSNWSESMVTWNSWLAPGGDFDGNTAYFAYLPDQGNCMVTLNISNLVQGWTNGTYPNYGLILYSTGPNHIISYSSKESGKPSEWPRLDIVYSVPSSTPTP